MAFGCSQSSSPPKIATPAAPKQKKRAGRKIFKETRHPLYRGVRRKNGGKWVCELREPNKKSRIWLGTFQDPETAAVAHDVAALALRGENAQLNFPDSAMHLPRARSSAHQDIRRAAFQASRDFTPSSFRFSQENQAQNTVEKIDGYETASDCGGTVRFVDEEAVFNLPVFLDSMAEGMLLTPLAMKRGFNWSEYEVDDGFELSLWEDCIYQN